MPIASKTTVRLIVITCVVTALASCAYQPEPQAYDPPGFFSAIFHGIVSPLALCFGIFSDIRIYAFPNGGWWYDFGFMIGLLFWSGGLTFVILDERGR